MRTAGLAVLGLWMGSGFWVIRAGAETYGFGTFLRRSVTVERRLAPEVQLSNVSINVVFPRGGGGLDEGRFKSQLETDIAGGGRNISLLEKDPQYELRLVVTSFDRPRVERQTQNGVTSATPKGGATMNFQLVHHADGQVIFAGTEGYEVGTVAASGGNGRSLFGVNLPSARANQNVTDESVALQLINQLAVLVASHLVVTSEDVQMMLARGPGLDAADKLAEAKRWNEYLETLSTMAPAAVPSDDAYRQYDIGVANEALGYAAEDPKITLKYLREASVNYSKAMEEKGSEKYFTTCQERIEKALSRYTTLDARNKQAAQMQEQDTKREHEYAARKKAGEIDNTDIIRLVQAGVDPSIITVKIRTAPMAAFDLSTDGLVQLSHFGVRANLINEMAQRMQTPSSPAPAPGTVRR